MGVNDDGELSCCDKLQSTALALYLKVAYLVYIILGVLVLVLAGIQAAKGDADPTAKTAIAFVIFGAVMLIIGVLAELALWKHVPMLFIIINILNVLLFLGLLCATVVITIVVWDVRDPVRLAVTKSWPAVQANLGAKFCQTKGGPMCTAEGANLTSAECVLSCKEKAIAHINDNQVVIEIVAFVLFAFMAIGYLLNDRLNEVQEKDKDAIRDGEGLSCTAKIAMVVNGVIMTCGGVLVACGVWVGLETDFESVPVKFVLALGIFVVVVGLLSILLLCAGLKVCGCSSLHAILTSAMCLLGFLCLTVALFMVATTEVIKGLNDEVDKHWVKVHDTFKTENPDIYAKIKPCSNYTAVAPTTTTAATATTASACKDGVVAEIRKHGKSMAVFSLLALLLMWVLIWFSSKYTKHMKAKDKNINYGGGANM